MPPLPRKLRKVGDSYVLTIPPEIAKALKLKEGDVISLEVEKGMMFAKKEEEEKS